jgi:hypothetical protein
VLNDATTRKTWRAWLLLAVACWACVAPTAAVTPNFALGWLETRTSDSFANDGNSRLAEPPQVADPHQGETRCAHERASRVHNYLYAHANPVGRIDPSGHMSLPGLASVGAAITTLGTMAVPVIQRAPQVMNTVMRGGAFVNQLAATLMARGQVLIAHSSEIVDDLGQTIGRFRIDLLAQRATTAGQQVNMMVEGKGVPWWLFGRPGWQSYLDQLTRQAQAFSQAVSTQGQAINERVIVFSSRAPAGLEKAWVEIQTKIAPYLWPRVQQPTRVRKMAR